MSKSNSGPIVTKTKNPKTVRFNELSEKKKTFYASDSEGEPDDFETETVTTIFDPKPKPKPKPKPTPTSTPTPTPRPKFTILVFYLNHRIIEPIELDYEADISVKDILNFLSEELNLILSNRFVNNDYTIELVYDGLNLTNDEYFEETLDELGILENANITANIIGEEVSDDSQEYNGGSKKRRRKTNKRKKTGKKRKTNKRRK
jgi:hypothetical protein